MFYEVSGQLPPKENPPPLVRVGVWVKVRVSLRVGGATRQSPHEENCPPVRVGVWLRISFVIEPC